MVHTRFAVITCTVARGLAGTSAFDEVEGNDRSQCSVFLEILL